MSELLKDNISAAADHEASDQVLSREDIARQLSEGLEAQIAEGLSHADVVALFRLRGTATTFLIHNAIQPPFESADATIHAAYKFGFTETIEDYRMGTEEYSRIC
jgi:hypothetical protein